MFRGIEVPAGKNILSAKLVFVEADFQNEAGNINLDIKALDPESSTTFTAGDMAQNRTALAATVEWAKSASATQSPDISALVQDIVNDASWQSGGAMSFKISNASGENNNVRHNLYAYDAGNVAQRPQLFITYGDDLVAPAMSKMGPSGRLSTTTTNTTLTVRTDESATCKYQASSDADFDVMASTMNTDGNVHTADLSGLSSDQNYLYFIRCMDTNGNQNMTSAQVSFSVASLADPIVTLTIDEPAGVARSNKNVRSGVPFPKGLLAVDDDLMVTQGDQDFPIQSRPLSLWPDGSVRWLLMDTQISLAAHGSQTIDIKHSPEEADVENPITVNETSEMITVNTGPLEFEVPKNSGAVINRASVDGNTVIEAPVGNGSDRGPWISVGDNDYFGALLSDDSVPLASDTASKYKSYLADRGDQFNQFDPWDLSVTIEEQGPLHIVIRVSGAHLNNSGLGFSSFVTRIHAYKGDSTLKIDHTLIFTGTGNDKITGYGFKLPYTGSQTWVEGTSHATGSVSHLAYDNFDVAGVSQTGQAKGYLARQNGTTNLSVTLKNMAENFPKALVASNDSLDVQLYPEAAAPLDLERYSTTVDTGNGEGGDGKNRGAQGLSKTETFFVSFASGNAVTANAEALAMKGNAGQLMALAEPDWYSDARVMGVGDFVFNTSLANSETLYRIDGVLHVIADFMRFNQREQFDWFGLINYGDIRGDFAGGCAPGHSADCTWNEQGRYGWSGNSGEPSNQLWLQFLRTQSRAQFIDAVALAKHTQDVQMIHYGDATQYSDETIAGGRNREFSVGSLHRHGKQAWSGYGQSPEYSHIAGVETYYYLTGDGRAKEALYEAGSFIQRYSENLPQDTALVNGIDTLSRAAAVFYDDVNAYAKFNNRLNVLLDYVVASSAVENEIADASLNGAFNYFIRGAGGLLYVHEFNGDTRAQASIFEAADIITSGGDKWNVGDGGSDGSVWFYINSLTYAASIADKHDVDGAPYYNLVESILNHNDHASAQDGTAAIPLATWGNIPDDWQDWVWVWDEGVLDGTNPALLHITRQLTFRNDFMQDYHSYRSFLHLSTAAALINE